MTELKKIYLNTVALFKEASIFKPEKDARVLICHVLNMEYGNFIAFPQKQINSNLVVQLNRVIQRRLTGEPVSKIIGRKMFWKNYFDVSAEVLDPRPETETIVSEVLARKEKKGRILDLGTGSGCLAISLYLELKNSLIYASDISKEALSVAKRNAKNLEANIKFIESNWFNNITEKFDIIVCNPPYLSTREIESIGDEVKNFDPYISLFAGSDPLGCYRAISLDLNDYLVFGGVGFFEVGYLQSDAVFDIFKRAGFKSIEVKKDLNNVERVVCVKKDA